jgi:perosamine synthetase
VADTWLTQLESKYANEAISHNWIGPNGSFNQRVETKFAEMLGQRSLLVSNGSVALMLGLRALGIGPGDEVLLPNLTYAATASSVVNIGATPVLCDVDEGNWGISVESMKMEFLIRATHDVKIKEIRVKEAQFVEQASRLIIFESEQPKNDKK